MHGRKQNPAAEKILMKVGFIQFCPVFGAKQRNFEKVCQLLKGVTADVLVLPELFNTGYTFLDKKELLSLAEDAGGETHKFVITLARNLNCLFAYGYAEKDGAMVYNSAALVSPQGIIGIYRKVHLFLEEKLYFEPGDRGFPVFEYGRVKYGLLICFDWIYPEAMRTLAIKGSQIILHCANLIMPHCPDAMITRALENRVYIITADRIGEENRGDKKYHFIGKSQVIAPNGEILARTGDEESIKVVDISPEAALNKKINPFNDLLSDRKEQLYFK